MNTQSLSENSTIGTEEPCLALRIIEPGKESRTVDLTECKYTIGSGAKCHVCLPSSEAQPLQCVIVQRDGVALITRWSAGCQLNGLDFSTSPIRAGDSLSIGAVVLELVSRADGEILLESEVIESREEHEPKEVKGNSDQRLKYLAKANHIARTRCHGFVASLREARNGEISCRKQVEQLERTLSQCYEQMAELAGDLELTRNDREQTQQVNLVHAATVERLQFECDELTKFRDCLATEHAASEQSRQDLEGQLSERDHRLGELSGELDSTRSHLQQIEQTATDRASQIDHLQSELGELTATRDGLAAERAASEQNRQDLEGQLSERDHRLGELSGERDGLAAKLEEFTGIHVANEQQQQALQEVLCHRDSRIEQLLVELESVRCDRDQSQQSNSEQVAQVERLQGDLDALSANRNDWMAEQTAMGHRQQELEVALSEQKEHVAGLKGELEAARVQCHQAEQLTEEQMVQKEQLQSEFRSLESDREKWTAEHALGEQRLQELEVELSQREGRLSERTEELELSQNQIVQIEHRTNEQKVEYQLCQEELQSLQNAIEQLKVAQVTGDDQQQALQHVLVDRDDRIEQLLAEIELSKSHQKQSQQVTVEQNAAQEQLQEKLTALEMAREQLVADRSASEENLEELESILSGRDRRLEELLGELEVSRAELDQHQEQRKQYEQMQVELESTKERLIEAECCHEQLQRRYDELANDLKEAGSTEDCVTNPARSSMLDSSEPESSENKEADSASTMEISVGEQSGSTPVSFIEQYQHLLEENGTEEFCCETNESELPSKLSNELSSHASSSTAIAELMSPITDHREEGDEALEDYMTSLMQRVGGSSPTAWKLSVNKKTENIVSQEQAILTEVAAIVDSPSADMSLLSDVGEMKQTPVKPVPSVDLTAMRELANQSAEQAITTHQKRHRAYLAVNKMVYCGIATSIALVSIFNSNHHLDLAFLGGCLAAMAGFYWAIQIVSSLLQVIRAGSESDESSELSESD
jgi:chromosome segregation ATPase